MGEGADGAPVGATGRSNQNEFYLTIMAGLEDLQMSLAPSCGGCNAILIEFRFSLAAGEIRIVSRLVALMKTALGSRHALLLYTCSSRPSQRVWKHPSIR